MNKKIIASVLAIVFAFSMVGPVSADTSLQDQINALLATIAQLQAQIAGQTATTTGLCLTGDLSLGMTSTAVKTLQQGLNQDPATQVAFSGAGSPGFETSYFGGLTKAAVIKFQDLYAPEVLASWGFTKGTGYAGSTTRAKFNALYCTPVAPTTTTLPGATTTTTTLVTAEEGNLQVSTAGVYTESSLKWAETNKSVLAFDVKALNSDMTIQRIDTQFAWDTPNSIFPWKTFKSFSLYSGDTEIKTIVPAKADYIENTYGQDYTLRMSGLGDIITKNATKTYTIKANLLDNPTSTNQYYIRLATTASAIRALDSAGIYQYAGGTSLTNTLTIASAVSTATIATSMNTSNPKEGNVIGDASNIVSNQELLRFNLKSTGDSVTLKTLQVGVTGFAYASAIKLYDGDTLLSSKAPAATTAFSNLSLDIAKDSTKALTIKADIRPIDGSTVSEGNTINAVLTANASNIVVSDSQDNVATITAATITGKTMHLYTVAPTFTFISGKITPDANSSGNATTEIVFSVTANGGDIYIPDTAVATDSTYDIITDVYGGTYTDATATSYVGTNATAGTTDNYLVPSGGSETFTISSAVATTTDSGLMGASISQIFWGTTDATIAITTSTSFGFELFKSGLINLH